MNPSYNYEYQTGQGTQPLVLALGYLSNPAPFARLGHAVHSALEGRTAFSLVKQLDFAARPAGDAHETRIEAEARALIEVLDGCEAPVQLVTHAEAAAAGLVAVLQRPHKVARVVFAEPIAPPLLVRASDWYSVSQMRTLAGLMAGDLGRHHAFKAAARYAFAFAGPFAGRREEIAPATRLAGVVRTALAGLACTDSTSHSALPDAAACRVPVDVLSANGFRLSVDLRIAHAYELASTIPGAVWTRFQAGRLEHALVRLLSGERSTGQGSAGSFRERTAPEAAVA